MIDRRAARIITAVAMGALVLAAAPSPRSHNPQQIGATPNVLIVITDDQRQGLGVMPATRRLVGRDGVRFDNGFTTTPLCCPARASIFTGRYAHNTGVHTEADANKLDQGTTLQYYLQQAGYRTALFGKYLNSWSIYNDPPFFDDWTFFTKSHSYHRGNWNLEGRVRRVSQYSTTFISDRAVEWLRQQSAVPDEPWLMYVAPPAPHSPFTAQRRYRRERFGRLRRDPAMKEVNRRDKPPYVRVQHAPSKAGSRVRTHQLRTLLSVDDMMGRLRRELEELGELDDTMIFFISDNGFLWGEHGLTRKAAPYTPSVGVPFLFRPAGGVSAVQDQRLVANVDIAPTVMEVVGLQPTGAPMDGRSLIGQDARDRILLEYFDEREAPRRRFQAPTWASIRTPSYQYVEYYGNDGSTVTFREYYDLDADPYQLRNILADDDGSNDPDPATLLLLSEQLARDRNCVGTTGPSACP